MVEKNAEKILVGNPTAVRGMRTEITRFADYDIYGLNDNLVAATGTLDGNLIYTHNRDRVSAVAVFPQGDGARVAFGCESGKVVLLRLEGGELSYDKEHFPLGGPVHRLIWSAKGDLLIVLGANASAIDPEKGYRRGDILGHTGKILCGVYT